LYTIEQCRYTAEGWCEYILADPSGILTSWIPEGELKGVNEPGWWHCV